MERHTNFIDRTGTKYITTEGYEIEIIEYFSCRNCTIRFNDSSQTVLTKVNFTNVKRGTVANPFHPSVYNKGCFGIGEFTSRDETGKKSKCYNTWKGMLERCYNEKKQEKNPTYEDVAVCNDWLNFQHFAKWFHKNYDSSYMKSWHLDKDILIKDNKIYSSTTCSLVPKEINNLLLRHQAKRGDSPIGVCKYKGSSCYLVQVSSEGKRITAYCSTPEKAFNEYKKIKEQCIKKVAEKWKSLIDFKVYEALLRYEVNIND